MVTFITTIIVGIICIYLGARNMTGDISSLHSYHRHRVSEEDKLPFGRLVGGGTIIIGAAVILMGSFIWVAEMTGNEAFALIGTGSMILGLVVGMALAFYGMNKYNNGIF